MHFQTFPTAIALLSAVSASPAFSNIENRQVTSGACSTGLHVIAVGGANYSNPYDLGRLTPTAQSIVARIPGSDWVSVPYEKMNIRTNPKAIPGGVTNLVNYVNEYHAACPDGKIALVGYSAGAVITMNSICDGYIDSGLAGNTIIATIAYGDQTRVPDLPYDKGTCTTGSGKLASKRDPAGCAAFANRIQSYCDFNDPECCHGPPQDYMIHFVYPGEYDGVVTEYVASKFEQAGRSVSASPASATSTPSAVGEALIATTAANSTAMASTTTPFSYTAATSAVAVTSAAGTSDTATFAPTFSMASPSSTLNPANPNSASSIAPVSGLVRAAFAAVLFVAAAAF